MEYGKLISRSVNLVWENKYLIVLGILAALGSGTFSGGGGGGGGSGSGNGNGQPFGEGQFPDISGEVAGLAIGVILALLCVAIFIGLALWAVSTIARGGLVAGVDAIESGQKSSFGMAWGAAWQKAWRLLGIGILPGIPGLILMVLALIGLAAYGGMSAMLGEGFALPLGGTELGIFFAIVACVLLPIILALTILRTFAERACMLEDRGVLDSYRRGWNVLSANLGEAIVLFVLQITIFIVLGILLFVPGIFLLLCCLLWPLLLALQGLITAAVSAVWTLAWREWTGAAPLKEKEPLAI